MLGHSLMVFLVCFYAVVAAVFLYFGIVDDMSLPKPYYEEPGITIQHGGCLEILPLKGTIPKPCIGGELVP
jgi:hypothetical protein